MDEFLKVENLKLHYRTAAGVVRAVDGVSLEIEKAGQALALIGESGCGKTSVGLALLRLLPNNVNEFSGRVWLDGQNVLSLPEEDFRRRLRWKKIAWVPQNTKGSLDPFYKIEVLFKEVLKTHDLPASENDILQLLSTVGLSPEKAEAIPDRLSGGEIQRACIALAVALKPSLIILDEPTSALDPSLKGQILSLLDDLKRRFSCSYIFITHDIHQASTICERFAVLYAGRVVEKGSREEVLEAPLHPYTRKLLECVALYRTGSGPMFIPGEPPDLRQLPSGCPFAPRCEYAMPVCLVQRPDLIERSQGRFFACHRAD